MIKLSRFLRNDASEGKRLLWLFYSTMGFVLLVSLLVLVGWFIENRMLIQVLPNFAPMQFNTALGFLMVSLGGFTAFRWSHLSRFFGASIAFLGSLTIFEYISGMNLGIDEFFMDASVIMPQVSDPGRMAPNTAICFILSGLFLLRLREPKTVICLTVALFILAFFALLGYFIGFEGLYGLGSFTRMALHTATCFLVLSIGFFIFFQQSFPIQRIDIWQVAPFVALVTILTLTILFWHSMKNIQDRQEEEHFHDLVDEKLGAIKQRFALYEHALLGGVGFVRGSDRVSRLEWREYVKALRVSERLPGTNGIGYIDKIDANEADEYVQRARADDAEGFTIHPETDFSDKFVIKYIEPESINEPAIGLDIGFEANRRSAAELAIDTGEIALTEKILLVQDAKKLPGFLLLAPVYENDVAFESVQVRREEFLGWVYSPFLAREFLAELESYGRGQVMFDVYNGDGISESDIIFSSDENTRIQENVESLAFRSTIYFAQQRWTFVWGPTPSYNSQKSPEFLATILAVGVFSAFLLSGFLLALSKLYGASAREAAAQQRRLESIFENTVDGIITIDQAGTIQGYNPACEEIFWYQASEVIGRNVGLLLLGPFRGKADGRLIVDTCAGMKDVVGLGREVVGRRKNGSEFPMEMSVSETKSGNSTLYTGIVRDITERKEMDTLKDEFISTVNHELRTPLTSIQTSLGLLRLDLGEALDEDGKRVLELAYNNCERLTNLVNDILDVEKIAAGKMDYMLESIEMIALIDEVVEQHQGYASKYKVKFVLRSELKTAYCEVDRYRFTQALVNLLSNAAKFSPENESVTIELAEEGDRNLRISVVDQGPGIPENFKKKIFTKFAQADSSSTRIKGGTGLGLNITKSIIEAFGGEISFESEEGKGSIFYFVLPITESRKLKEK